MSPALVPPGRLVGLDVARCLALLGMIATHTLVDSTPDGGVTVVQGLAGGRASALFAVLAGVSLALVSGRVTPYAGRRMLGVRAGLAARAGLIALIGLLLGSLPTTIAVILTYYGLLFLLGLPFLRLRSRTLLVLAAAWAVGAPALSHALRPLLPDRTFESPSFDSLGQPGLLLADLLVTGFYPALTWMAYLLLGLALGRTDLSGVRPARLLLVAGAATATGAVLLSELLLRVGGVRDTLAATLTGPQEPGGLADTLEHGLYGSTPTGSWWWLAVHGPHTGTPFDLLHTGGSAAAVVGACLLVSRLAPRTFAVVFGAGTMTLTLYTLHVFLRVPEAWPADDLATFSRHVAVVLVLGAAYRAAGRRGPLERAVGWLAGRAARSVAAPARERSGDPLVED